MGRLRRGEVLRAMRVVLVRIAKRVAFRVVHLSIQHNHLHLLVEAEHTQALTLGMQAFAIAAAKAINRSLGRSGKVFEYRYHATAITNPRQAHHALSYVLNNWRRHREHEANEAARRAALDPYSSALAFTGWTETFVVPRWYEPLGVARPRTWLLATGWSIHGKLDPRVVPGRP